MNSKQFQQLLQKKQQEIQMAIDRTLPIKIGRIAKNHIQENFRKGGFQNNGLKPWKRKKHNDKYSPLMSSRQHLYGSIQYKPNKAQVTVGTNLPYADIHNDGGQIIVTARMKRFFWAKHRETNGNSWKKTKNNDNFWKALALKPVGATIKIPKRQFIGESKELNTQIADLIEKEINNILKQ